MVQISNRQKQTDKKRNLKQTKDDALNLQQKQCPSEEFWTPSVRTAFKVLMSARLSAAVWSNISDCDEAFNYWEPVHYLIHGHGLQTWEYSPLYAIRSYAYLWLYAIPIKLWNNFYQGDKIAQFLLLRCMMALVSTACETYFYKAIWYKFGANVSRLSLLLLMFSPGMFISSTAFLPSSFAMYTTMLALAFWWHQHSPVFSIFFVALGSLLGWPFAAALGIPIAFDFVVKRKKFYLFVVWSFVSLVVCLVPIIMIDSHYFGKFNITPLNIILYNVFSEHGPELYGVEPWTFYFVNGFLNFNLAFPMAVISLPLLILWAVVGRGKPDNDQWLYIMCLHIWMLIFFTRPHKEERFLFPVYPIICLSAAVTFNLFQQFLGHLTSSTQKKSRPSKSESSDRLVLAAFCIIFVVLSVARILSLHHGYHAPLKVYANLNKVIMESPIYKKNQTLNVCVGKEWYRFPSHFFLPERCHLKFIKSEFRGQLPAEFPEGPDATRQVPRNVNDLNLEEMDRYVQLSSCHYLIDLDTGRSTKHEPNYSRLKNQWKSIISEKFLDASRSGSLARAFYVPFLTARYMQYINYNVLVPVSNKES